MFLLGFLTGIAATFTALIIVGLRSNRSSK